MPQPFSLTLAALLGQGERSLAPYGLRHDGSGPKGKGFLGALLRPDGGVSTELSAGMNIDGKEIEVPLLVPTLTRDEIAHLLAGNDPTEQIFQKAQMHAAQRIKEGTSPFSQPGELRGSMNWNR